MQKKKIETLKDLQDEKKLVRERLAKLEQDIMDDVESLKHGLESWRTAGNAVKTLFVSKQPGMLGVSVGAVVETLIKKLLLRKSNFVTRFIISFLLKNVARNLVAKNSDIIVKKVKKIMGNVADKTDAMSE
jgi:hypothetical protein